MTHDQTGYLNAVDRARLRSTIDIEALECFLAATPPGFHRFFFLACVTEVSDSERQELGVEPGYYRDPSSFHFMAGGLLNAALRTKWEEVEPSHYRGA